MIISLKALSLYANFCEEIFAHENRVFSEWLRVATEVEGRHLQESLLIFRGNKLVSTFDVSKSRLFVF